MKAFYLLLAMVLLVGCNQAETSPQGSAQKYLQFLAKEDWGNACQMLDAKSRERAEAWAGGCVNHLRSSFYRVARNDTSTRVSLVRQQDGWAEVSTDIEGNTLYLRQENGRWFVSFLEPPFVRES